MPRRRPPKRPNPKAIAAAAHRQSDAGPDRVVCLLCGEEFRAIGWLHLRALHGLEGPHPVEDYKARFGLRVACSEETCEIHRDVRVEYWEARGQHWTKARIRRTFQERRRMGLSVASSRVPVDLYDAARRLYGGWPEALRAAGFAADADRERIAWDDDRIVAEIHRRGQRNTCKSAKWARENHADLYRAVIRRFGKWSNALKLARLDPSAHREPRRVWTMEVCRSYVRSRARGDVAPAACTVPSALYHRVRAEVDGGWPAFVTSLGLKPLIGPRRTDWSRKQVVAAIRARRKAGLPVTAEQVKQTGKGLWAQGRHRFGSWDAALEAAGIRALSVKRRHDWTRDDVLDSLRARAKRRLSMHYRAVEQDEPRLYKATRRLLPGGWDAALAEAGVAGPTRAQRRGRKK